MVFVFCIVWFFLLKKILNILQNQMSLSLPINKLNKSPEHLINRCFVIIMFNEVNNQRFCLISLQSSEKYTRMEEAKCECVSDKAFQS